VGSWVLTTESADLFWIHELVLIVETLIIGVGVDVDYSSVLRIVLLFEE
jgi:hypothetical protein